MSRKTKTFTTKQLNRARLRARLEAKQAEREARSARYRLTRREARALEMFRGCDPERTLDLLGEDA